MIAERELGRVKDEIQRLQNEMASIQEKKSDKEVCVKMLLKILCCCSFIPHQQTLIFFLYGKGIH